MDNNTEETTELTDEQLATMSDDEFEQHSEGTEGAGAEPELKTTDEHQETDEEKLESSETESEEVSEKEEKPEESDLPEGYDNWDKSQKGIFHAMKEEREKRQEAQRQLDEYRLELERLRSSQETTERLIKEGRINPNQNQPQVSNYEAVKAEIAQRAQQYEQEYGEPYRPSYQELDALENAKAKDQAIFEQKRQQEYQQQQQSEFQKTLIRESEQSEAEFKAKLAEQGRDDYDYVFENFVKPVIEAEVEESIERSGGRLKSSPTLEAIALSKNKAETAYNMMARHPEGLKYLQKKIREGASKDLAKDIIKQTEKEIPTTSAGAGGGKSEKGTLVTQEMLDNDESLYERLTDDQFEAFTAGEEVYI